MLEQSETLRLIALAKKGDSAAKETLLVENTPLLKSIINRYRNKGVEYDDLFQLASMGFIKAINNFDTKFEVKFSTYAVPMIAGEIKRFLRDDGYIKVSRSLKVLSVKINRYIESFRGESEREPTVEEIAEHFGVETSDVLFAMDSAKLPISIYDRTDDQDEKSKSYIEKLAAKESGEDVVNKLLLKDVINELDAREKKIVILRYFRDMTQSEIAREMGVSQVQVSRLEVKILAKIKEKMTDVKP